MTALQVMFEWQRDWARTETYDGCMEILKMHTADSIGARFVAGVLGERSNEARAAT